MALNLAAPNWSTKYSRAYWHAISSPFKLTKKLTALAPKLLSSNDDNKKAQSSIPDTPFNCEPSADRIIRHIGMPIEKIHTIEKQSGCTINEIALCIIAGALRNYLLQQDKLPKESLVAGMPIDVRSKKNKAAIGNQISFANVCLYSDIENPKIRLACIHEASLASKQKNQKMGPKSLVAILDNIYPGVLVWAGKKLFEHHLFNKLPRLNNTIVTNVPGIPVPCYLCGAELVDYLGFGPLAPTTSLFHVISSTHSHINISFIGSSNSLKDPDSYMKSLQKSYRALLKDYQIR
jgi:WS/DGAT/MGAT family acyltransferase